MEVESYCPWDESEIEIVDRKYLHYKGQPISDTNQPPPHPVNVDAKTADEFRYKVYTLGLRGAMKGLIFPNVDYIDEFPDIAYTYGNDFGFTSDPNALVRFAQQGNDLFFELLIYSPIETPETLAETFKSLNIENYLPITCDSSDKYTGENKGTVEMVRGLQDQGFEASKVRKTQSLMYWLLEMRSKNIHIVKSNLYSHAKKEQENYIFKEINGIQINQPIDNYNHFWDAARYAYMAYNENNSQMIWQ